MNMTIYNDIQIRNERYYDDRSYRTAMQAKQKRGARPLFIFKRESISVIRSG